MSGSQQVQAVVDAWRNPGRVPSFHREWQNRLRHEWPVLARALDRLEHPDARAARAVEQERARVVALVRKHTALGDPLGCTECDWEGFDHDEHLADLIKRGEHGQASDA